MPLALEAIRKSYGDKRVLRGVSHVFPERGAAAIVGPSGCGKTTLMRILLGLERPDSGALRPQPLPRMSAVFQEDRLIGHMSARANLSLVAPALTGEEIASLLAETGLEPHDSQPVSRYSGGMRRRVALARALAVRPEILCLDEPFNGLDEAVRARCAEAVFRRMAVGLVLVVTHDGDEEALLRCADRLELPPPEQEEERP